jgi:hypothetical protein
VQTFGRHRASDVRIRLALCGGPPVTVRPLPALHGGLWVSPDGTPGVACSSWSGQSAEVGGLRRSAHVGRAWVGLSSRIGRLGLGGSPGWWLAGVVTCRWWTGVPDRVHTAGTGCASEMWPGADCLNGVCAAIWDVSPCAVTWSAASLWRPIPGGCESRSIPAARLPLWCRLGC